jgi:hypothetical protein
MKSCHATKWVELKQLFEELNQRIGSIFTPAEQEEVMSFVRTNEFGLGLETFTDICKEEKKDIPAEVRELVARIAQKMNISPEPFFGSK